MNTRKFSESMMDLDDHYIEEASADTTSKNGTAKAPQPPRKKRVLWLIAAFTVCVFVAFGGRQFFGPPSDEVPTVITHMDLSDENGAVMSSSGSYPVPKPGVLLFETEVQEARRLYLDDEVQFVLKLDLSDANQAHINGEALEEEYRRLQEAGIEFYTVEHWHYQGRLEKVPLYTVVAYLTEDQLTHFPTNADYGYFFTFPKNGDGSPVDIAHSTPLDFNE